MLIADNGDGHTDADADAIIAVANTDGKEQKRKGEIARDPGKCLKKRFDFQHSGKAPLERSCKVFLCKGENSEK